MSPDNDGCYNIWEFLYTIFELTHKVISVGDEDIDGGGLVGDDFGADGGSAEVHLAALCLVDWYGWYLAEYLRKFSQ